MEENNQGISSSLILIVLALIVLGAGVYYVITQMGNAQVAQPTPTQYAAPTQYPIPSSTPAGSAINNVSDLDKTTQELNSPNPDTQMNADLNGLNTDSAGL